MNRSIQNCLVVSILFLLTACGGGDSSPPPPAAGVDTQALKELQNLAKLATQTCCQSAAPFMIKVAQAVVSNNPSNGPTQEPNMSSCQNAISNFEGQFRTMGNGQYAQTPAAQQWREAQGKNVVECVGDQLKGAGLPVGPEMFSVYFAAAQSLTQRLRNAVPSIQLPTNIINPRSSLGGNTTGGNSRGLTYSTGTNPYATNGTGTNPYATGSGTNYTSTQPPLNSTFGAPRFDSPNAANEIFGSVPTFPGWQASNL